MTAGASPVEAFGLTFSRADRERRNEYLRAAVEKMPADWSASRRAKRIVDDAERLAVFAMRPWMADSDKPWAVSVLKAVNAAPLPSRDELRKLVGGF